MSTNIFYKSMRFGLIFGALLIISFSAAFGADFFVRYSTASGINFGRLSGKIVHVLNADFLTGGKETGETISLDKVRLLAPVVPGKVIAVGLNYASHSGSSGAGNPGLFLKLPTSIIGPTDPIPYPPDARSLHYEGEMVIVIGKAGTDIPKSRVKDHVFGVTAGNDVSERSWQSSDLQWLRAKASDGFGPIGPVVARGLDWSNLVITTRLNGKVVQQESTASMIHSVEDIVAFTSRYVTLHPGDVIFTGTPGSTSAMRPGDSVEVELEKVGNLVNPVKRK